MHTRSNHRWNFDSGVKNALNLSFINFESDFPLIECKSIKFNNIVPCNNYKHLTKDSLVSMFVDDYILERYWRNPLNYITRYKNSSVVMSPDFSILLGMPKPLIYYQTYKNRLIGKIWKDNDINVLPTVSWSDKNSYDIVFNGINKNSIISVSNIGCRNDKHLLFFEKGYNEMIKRLNPKKIVFMCNKKYKHYFNDDNVIFIKSFWDNKREKWVGEVDKV